MTEVKEILDTCNAALTGDLKADLAYLETQSKRYAHHEKAVDILREISELAFSLLPQERKDYLTETTMINGKRLDAVFDDASKLVKEKKYEEAALTLHSLTNKVLTSFPPDAENCHYRSFRNPFEYHMYIEIYGTDDKLERAPFDCSMYFNLLGYVLLELHRTEDAIEALEQAIRYNPVSCDARYELAEAFKASSQNKKLLATIKEILRIANSTYALARCYGNAGYYCVEIKDYDAAVCFFYESLLYNNHPGIHAELRNLVTLTGKQITPPTRDEVLAAFQKYDLPNGPSDQLVALAVVLAGSAIEQKRYELGGYFYSIAYDLTRDPDIEKRLQQLRPQIDAERAAAKQESQA